MNNSEPIAQYTNHAFLLQEIDDETMFLRVVNSQMGLEVSQPIENATSFTEDQAKKMLKKHPNFRILKMTAIVTLYNYQS